MRIGIYDDNAYYLNRVCEIMNERYSNEMKLVPLNEKDLSGAGDISFDLLIVGEEAGNNIKISAPIAYLTEEKGSFVQNGKVFVFKYYNVQMMYEAVIEAAENVKKIAEERERQKIAKEQEERTRREREEWEAREKREKAEREQREKAERERIERERIERERIERERIERERIEREKIEERERQDREERTRKEQQEWREKAERERIEKEEREKQEQDKQRADRNIDISAYNCKIITYVSLGGGMGSSTVAAGTAAYFAKAGKRVLYVSLDPIDSTGYFTVTEQNISMSDIVNDIEKNGNNTDELFNNICVSREGVFVTEGFRNQFEVNKLNNYIVEEILASADRFGKFDMLIMDIKAAAAEWITTLLKASSVICYVVDGSNYCNKKIFNANSFMSGIDGDFNNKLRIIYNKYKVMPKVEKSIEDKVMGGISYVESENPQDVISKMLKMKFLNNLIK